MLRLHIASTANNWSKIKINTTYFTVTCFGNVTDLFNTLSHRVDFRQTKFQTSTSNEITATNPSPSYSINQYCVTNKRDLFAMKKRDLKSNKTINFSLSPANLRNRAIQYGKRALFSLSKHLSLSSHILIKARQQCSKLQCVSHHIALSNF